jgi:uncharacterized membrane protein
MLLGARAPIAVGEDRATFTPIGDLPGGLLESYAFGVSGDGNVVVGWSNIGGPVNETMRAFRWTRETGMQALEHTGPAANNSMAVACSFDGSIIVGLDVLWSNGRVQTLDCTAIDISADGTVLVGHCGTEVGMPCGQSMMDMPNVDPIRWSVRDGMTSLGDVPGGVHYGLGMAISADGSTIVGDAINGESWDAFRWTADDGFDVLNLAFARDVSGDGDLVVGSSQEHGAYLWPRGEPAMSLQELLEAGHGLDLAGWTLTSAEGISENGLTIVGFGTNPQGNAEAWVVTLPDPMITCAGDIVSAVTFQPPPDGHVDAADLAFLLGAWGANPGSPADTVTSQTFAPPPDGNVDGADLAFLLGGWGGCK